MNAGNDVPRGSWLPNGAQSVRDKNRLTSRASAAIKDLVQTLSPGHSQAVQQILRGLKKDSNVCHPEIFHWYFSLRQHPERAPEIIEDLFEVREAVVRSCDRAKRNLNNLGVCVDTSSDDAGVSEALRHGSLYAARLIDGPVALRPLGSPKDEVEARIRDAFELIRQVWPELLEEFPAFVQKLIVYEGHAVIGFTDFRYHGSIFFKYEWLMRRQFPEEVAEDLVHEAAHVRLNAIMGATPLFTNDDREIYTSPLRPDLRSMYGVFHQMFVLLRVSEFYRRLQRKSLMCCEQNLADRLTGFEEAYETVRSAASLTPAGLALVNNMREFQN